MRSFYLTLFLGCLAALAPLVIEASLPAVPTIADDLATSLSMTQWSFTGILAGMAAGERPTVAEISALSEATWGKFMETSDRRNGGRPGTYRLGSKRRTAESTGD
jgi:hypothetical protein